MEQRIGRPAPARIAGWRQPAMRNIFEHVSAVRVCVPSGARGAAVAYAEVWEQVFHLTMAEGSGIGGDADHTGSIPVRHHWIAQLGRASDVQSESRGFESRSKTHDLSRHDIGTQVPSRKRPVRRVDPCKGWRGET